MGFLDKLFGNKKKEETQSMAEQTRRKPEDEVTKRVRKDR